MMARLAATSTPLLAILILHLILIPVLVIGIAIDSRQILGLNPWVKPLKFVLSTSLYMATVLALLAILNRPSVSAIVGWGVGLLMLTENVLICLQSFRGQTSHFNTGSAFDVAVFGVMGVAIAVNTLLVAGLLVAFADARGLTIGPGLLWGIRLGLVLFLAGSAQAGLMLSRMAHTVGAPDGGPGLPFINWSTRAGDLRIAHFVGLHAIQVLPVVGLFADRMASFPVVVVLIASLLYGGLFILLILQALAGKPFIA